MSAIRVFLNAMLGLAATGAVGTAFGARASDGRLRAELEALGRRKVFFGHRSVGMNLVEGVQQLAAQEGVPLRIVEISGTVSVAPGTFAHAFVSENGNPASKLESFARALGPGPASVDVAFVKFCYVDFRADMDVQAIFAKYQATIADLRAKHPGTTFVHVTAPLTSVQGGAKAVLKRLMGRPPAGLAENARREDYNALLRRAYQGREPMFDLAAIESTLPEGRRETTDWNGRSVPALAAAYTDDGGHLNRAGKLRAARVLVGLLASVPTGDPAAAPGVSR